jgi:hypothetical protein
MKGFLIWDVRASRNLWPVIALCPLQIIAQATFQKGDMAWEWDGVRPLALQYLPYAEE